MSVMRRAVHGTVALWSQFVLSFAIQIALVPLYLAHWSAFTYGVWLGLQSVVSILTQIDRGHLAFMEGEFYQTGPDDRDRARQLLERSWSLVVLTSLIAWVVFGGLSLWPRSTALFGLDAKFEQPTGVWSAAAIYLFSWSFLLYPFGLVNRALIPFGYFPQVAWYGVWSTLMQAGLPALAVANGASLLQTAAVYGLAVVLMHVPIAWHMHRWLKREDLWPRALCRRVEPRSVVGSVALSGRQFLETARFDGLRLILNPLVGATAMSGFAVTRTAANTVAQSFGLIASPLTPELVAFGRARRGDALRFTLYALWALTVLAVAPLLVALQISARWWFSRWTHGQISFDPWLFAFLGGAALLYVAGRPATALVQGFNWIKPQLSVAIASVTILVAGTVVGVPRFGIRAAGAALLAAEAWQYAAYRALVRRLLRRLGIEWPRQEERMLLVGIAVTTGILLAVATWPSRIGIWILGYLFYMLLWLRRAFRLLPPVAYERFREGVQGWFRQRRAQPIAGDVLSAERPSL